MNKYTPSEIFCPKTYPEHTYIDRNSGNQTYTYRMKRAIMTPGTLVTITGASKSGKTVLCHNVISKEAIINISGAQIKNEQDFWNQIAERIPLPIEQQHTESKTDNISIGVKGNAGTDIPFIGGAKLEISGNSTDGSVHQLMQKRITNSRDIIQYLLANDKVLLLDDFHYLTQDIQLYLARVLKAEMFNGLKVVITTLPHKSDEAVRLNPDLIGRTAFIDIEPWTMEELSKIAEKGFSLLEMTYDEGVIELLTEESLSSPQLMQENCLNVAWNKFLEQKTNVTIEDVRIAFKESAMGYSHYKGLFNNILHGPAQGRSSRKKYKLQDGTKADLYDIVMKIIVIDPPVLSMNMNDIEERLHRILSQDEKIPSNSSIIKTVNNISKLLPNNKQNFIEWKDEILYINDPFFMFYLRWNK